jgi:hypothetical protein
VIEPVGTLLPTGSVTCTETASGVVAEIEMFGVTLFTVTVADPLELAYVDVSGV